MGGFITGKKLNVEPELIAELKKSKVLKIFF